MAVVCLCLLISGCVRHDITLNNGDVIRAKTKPKRDPQGFYVFKDLTDREVTLNPMRVRQIETVRTGSKPSKPF